MRLFLNRKTLKKIAKEILPPFIHESLRKLFLRDKDVCRPSWHTVRGGILRGRELFLDPAWEWQRDILEGRYDSFLLDYVKDLPIRGRTVLEIGAHVGFHVMNFAQLVGEEGMVYAFEPNRFNRERMEINLRKNPDLARRVRIFGVAVSDAVGETDFYFSEDVDRGTSSGNFISGADTYYPKSEAYLASFKIMKVRMISLDHASETGTDTMPYIIKIDVEGAEGSVVRGAMKLLDKHKPLLLIEVHSIRNMLEISESLHSLQYTIVLLKEEKDGRCFIAASPLNKGDQ